MRRQDAITILADWWNAEDTARYYERWSSAEAAKVMRKEADDLREGILMLMGVDETPAAKLEVVDAGKLPSSPAGPTTSPGSQGSGGQDSRGDIHESPPPRGD